MHVEIVTPVGTAVSTDVDEVVAPGSEGEFGVLPGHSAFMSAMKPGVLRYRKGSEQHLLAVGAGLVEVTGNDDRVVVLAERVARPEDIDSAAARKELEEADAALKGTTDAAAEQKRAWAQAKLDTVRK